MVELMIPLVFGLLMLLTALSRLRREMYGSGLVFMAAGLVLLLHSGLDVSGATVSGLQVGWISQPSACASHGGLRC
jgi:hypothetical protein